MILSLNIPTPIAWSRTMRGAGAGSGENLSEELKIRMERTASLTIHSDSRRQTVSVWVVPIVVVLIAVVVS